MIAGRTRALTAIAFVWIGIAFLVAAIAANQGWLDRHFLPSFFMARSRYVQIQTMVRLAFAIVGISLALLARSITRLLTRRVVSHVTRIAIAAVLAFVAGEAALRYLGIGPTAWLLADDEPKRQSNARLGWILVPDRVGKNTTGGHTVEYAIDRSGYRVRSLDEPVDHERPAIIFAGESVMFGEGLSWEESIPAQVGAMMEIDSANLAVHGFSTDQTYLRLAEELPRFHRPVAVVSLFMATLFGRNLDQDRPHLGPGLVWLAPVENSRLKSLATLLAPYRSDRTVERGITMTREAMTAMVALARQRGAEPVIAVIQFGKEQDVERTLRRRIIEETGLPFTFIEVDESWRFPWNQHPDARASHAIAKGIAEFLCQRAPRCAPR